MTHKIRMPLKSEPHQILAFVNAARKVNNDRFNCKAIRAVSFPVHRRRAGDSRVAREALPLGTAPRPARAHSLSPLPTAPAATRAHHDSTQMLVYDYDIAPQPRLLP